MAPSAFCLRSSAFETWRSSFWQYLQQKDVADGLKTASLCEDLRQWTSDLTTAVVKSCEAVGWVAAAKGNPCKRLPKKGQEYLGIDVMALPAACGDECRWPMPLAVFELENHHTDDRVAYSLWKVLCIRAGLRVVFAYRPDWEQGRQLVSAISRDVIGGMKPEERSAIDGQTVVVVGNRGEGETFPWGYFKFWALDANLGRFGKI
ncbi:MAG: hypothetical protein GXY83_27915 [Rhodopirellula sp.]|nr:hypothetical protein [Rhodopirellula sp.]